MDKLGKNVANLAVGTGFGELAILSATHKFRTASAVCKDDNSILFIINQETYNSALRRHHFRQQEMSHAVQMLRCVYIHATFNSPI
jgi:hypothetical protein